LDGWIECIFAGFRVCVNRAYLVGQLRSEVL